MKMCRNSISEDLALAARAVYLQFLQFPSEKV